MIDLKVLMVEKEDCDAGTVQQLRNGLLSDKAQYKVLRDAADTLRKRLATAVAPTLGKIHLKLGISLYFLGHPKEAAEHLGNADGALAAFYQGRILASRGLNTDALAAFEKAEKSGYNASQVNLQRVGVHRQMGKLTEAEALLEKHKDLSSHSAEFHYQQGQLRLKEGKKHEGVDSLEKAIKFDPNHTGALFQLAMLNDQAGNDDEAVALYEKCRVNPPVHTGTLTNLGVLYEDQGKYDKAHECYKMVLQSYPSDEQARLYVKDAVASQTMIVVHDDAMSDPQMVQVFELSVNDFELSVRARNCLRRMSIKTLGDLTRISEDQLLTSKNFGETSLVEIKEMLSIKGLRLGQSLEAGGESTTYRPVGELSEEDQLKLAAPITDLQLSVRARKCMSRLTLSTIAELVCRSSEELMEARNFGVTSLNEVREKLRERGLALRGE
ncbi:MAG: tetratricopeptide repeat protein [Planctomycetota bacterium]|nr:tetratricopeptide repeat protein [Planctomycetota bacterium]RLS38230.1 MAG: tetratricopeptide repeat protein [Planctomycetota bacterium]